MSTDYKHTCFFTGHRIISPNDRYTISDKLKEMCIKLITQFNVTDFITGGALGFDTIAAVEVLKLKIQYPHIRLHLYLPCINQTEKWKNRDVKLYDQIKEKADEVRYISTLSYLPGCMQMRNRAMVNDAYYGIAYCKDTSSGTYSTVKYARQKDRNIVIID